MIGNGRPPLALSYSSERFPSDRIVSSPSSSRNPITLRLYKALSSTFHDSASREALETLDAYYADSFLQSNASQVTTDTVTRDSNRDAHPIRDDEITSSSPFALKPGADVALAEHARKHLRRDIEKSLTESSRRFLEAFGEVDMKLEELQIQMQSMTDRCDQAESELNKTSESCKYLLDKAGSLRNQRQLTATRQTIINAFLSRFTLSDAELEAITSHDVPVGKQLFAAMDRAEAIREDCKILLSGEAGDVQNATGMTAGIDIMAQTAAQLDIAYAKIQRWCSFEFHKLGKDTHPEVQPGLCESVSRLRVKRPEVLIETLSDLTVSRQTGILNSFMVALTRGGPSGHPRPIELHAHDPIRYVGDMLAWVHQAMASEREFLEALFFASTAGDERASRRRMVGSVWVRDDEGGKDLAGNPLDPAVWVTEIMNSNLDKLSAPLKHRIQQTIKSQEGSITAYKITNLLQFYYLTMQRTLGQESRLTLTLKQMTVMSHQVFLETIAAQGRSMLRFLQPPDSDLLPPLPLRDFAQVLREIMAIYASSLLEDDFPDPKGERDKLREGFNRMLDAAVEPCLEMCKSMSEMRKGAAIWEKETFLINCTTFLQSIFQPFDFAQARVVKLESLVIEHTEHLVKEHYTILLRESGLAPITESLGVQPTDSPLSLTPAASPMALTEALAQFDKFLSSPALLTPSHSSRLSLISSPRLSSLIHHQTLEKLGEAYGGIVQAVRDPKNKYEFASTVLGAKRPFGQMNVLWQVLGVEKDP